MPNIRRMQMGAAGAAGGGPFNDFLGEDYEGYLWCAGSGSDHIGGFGSTGNESSPVLIGSTGSVTPETWKSCESAGGRSGIGIRTDGTLWGWGSPYDGCIGTDPAAGNVVDTDDNQIGSSTDWVHAHNGYNVSHAINSSGELWGLGGEASYGSLGLGTTASQSALIQIGSLTDWSKVYGDQRDVACLKSDGTIWCWGQNGEGQCANGVREVKQSSPIQWGSESNWLQLSVSPSNLIALNEDGELWGCGNDYKGALGRGTFANFVSTPTRVGTGADNSSWVWVATVNRTTVGVKSDGTMWGCGDNTLGQLGLGTTSYRELSFLQESTGRTDWIKSDAGGNKTMYGFTSAGTIWGTGYNAEGQLGLGTTTNMSVFTQSGSLTTWVNMIGGRYNLHGYGSHNT